MEYTGIDFSNFLKHNFLAVSESDAAMFWVNYFEEGRKEATTSKWELRKEKPTDPKVRYYPAYSKEFFAEHILPRLFTNHH